jgi:hypothetical protein
VIKKMVQVLEKEEIYIIIPKAEEIEEKAEEEVEKPKKKVKSGRFAKKHQKRICINNMRNKVDASVYRSGYIPY